jgi:hypothetical protein
LPEQPAHSFWYASAQQPAPVGVSVGEAPADPVRERPASTTANPRDVFPARSSKRRRVEVDVDVSVLNFSSRS